MADEAHLELIQQFVDSFHATQSSLDKNDTEGAASGYKDMLGVYNKIAASDLDPMHKELAYDQLVKAYQGLQNPRAPQSMHATTHIIAAAVLLVLFSFLVFFKPTVFGMVSAEPKIAQDLNFAFVESGSRAVHLDAAPKQLSISGKIDGGGMVRVYAVSGDSRVLLFDNNLVSVNSDGTFNAACVRCNQGLDNRDFALDAVVENAALTVYSVEYRK